jgi:MFS family permease
LDALVVATALPTLHQEYGGGVEVLGWTVDAYQLAFAASILTGATLGDRFGRRQMFVSGVLVFTAASALCAVSPTVEVLLAARAAQGVGGGLAVPLSVALIIDAVTPQQPTRFWYTGAGGTVQIDAVYDAGLEFGQPSGYMENVAARFIAATSLAKRRW